METPNVNFLNLAFRRKLALKISYKAHFPQVRVTNKAPHSVRIWWGIKNGCVG